MSGWYEDGSEEEAQMAERLRRREWEEHQERLQLERAQEKEMQRLHELKMDAAEDMYEALRAVKDAFRDDAYLKEWVEREDNREGASLGFFLNATQIKAMITALAAADGTKEAS